MTREEAIEKLQEYDNVAGLLMTVPHEVLTMAIESLEKQLPKKPKQYGVTDTEGVFHPINGVNGVPYDLCPNCETNLCTDGFFGRSKNGFNYCEYCGQRIDWSKENERTSRD